MGSSSTKDSYFLHQYETKKPKSNLICNIFLNVSLSINLAVIDIAIVQTMQQNISTVFVAMSRRTENCQVYQSRCSLPFQPKEDVHKNFTNTKNFQSMLLENSYARRKWTFCFAQSPLIENDLKQKREKTFCSSSQHSILIGVK